VVLDTRRYIFGGFTPVEWEARKWKGEHEDNSHCLKADPSQKSFLFTLTNPHNIPARRFALKAEKRLQAIDCDSKCGPVFGGIFSDIGVRDNCNAHTLSSTSLGFSYTNDTGLNEITFITGSGYVQVKEIEVFEITHETARPPSLLGAAPELLLNLISGAASSASIDDMAT
jgi:hypothetical protein